MVEFFAIGRSSKKIMNTTEAYYKLTEKGQNFHYTSYHILKVDMKGILTQFTRFDYKPAIEQLMVSVIVRIGVGLGLG